MDWCIFANPIKRSRFELLILSLLKQRVPSSLDGGLVVDFLLIFNRQGIAHLFMGGCFSEKIFLKAFSAHPNPFIDVINQHGTQLMFLLKFLCESIIIVVEV